MTITQQGMSGDGRPIVYWDDGSWSYADNFDMRGIPQDGIGTSDNPVYHFTGDPSQPKPGSDGSAYTLVGGSKQFVEPSLFGGQVHQSDNSFWNQGDQWDAGSGKYVSKGMDRGNILSLGIGGVLGGDFAGALGAFGGGAPAGGGVADMGAVDPAAFAAGGWTPGLGAAGGAALPSGAAAAGVIPDLGPVDPAALPAGGWTGQGSMGANPLFDQSGNYTGDNTFPQDTGGSGAWGKLGSLLTGPLGKVLAAGIPAALLAKNAFGGPGGSGSNLPPSPAIPPELTQLLQMAMQRTNYQTPLFQAATAQAFGGLPTYAQQGITPPNPATYGAK